MDVQLVVVAVTALLAAVVSTWGVRAVMLRLGFLDQPNERSAHTAPAPTLGGLGIVAGCWAGLGLALGLGIPMASWVWKGMLAASVALLVLVRDDIAPMGRTAKLSVQSVAAACVLWWALGPQRIGSSPLEAAGWMVALVALQNFYNFMDGIDGLAGFEGVLVGSLFLVLSMAFAADLAVPSAAVAGACIGFLFWNAPTARIFMGDVGSHFLGLMFGVLSFGVMRSGIGIEVPALFLGAFLFDALYTLIRRLLKGENITVAHRFHLYQRLQILGIRTGRVCMMYGVITLLMGATACLLHLGVTGPAAATGSASAVILIATTLWVEREWAKRVEENSGV